MTDINELRRKVNSTDIVDHIDLHANIKPFLSEMIDRLEAAEQDALEQARLNGMGGEREAALMAKLKAAEKAIDFAKEEVERLLALARDQNNELIRLREEGRTLRAKIAEMERQGPVRHEFQGRDGDWYPFIDHRHYEFTVTDRAWPIRTLYILPGAKGEEK